MEIIKRGQVPEEKTYEATCRRRSTDVRFPQQEAKRTFDQRDGDFLTVKCPVCGHDINVDG